MPILEILESPSSARLVSHVITQGLENVRVNGIFLKKGQIFEKLKSESERDEMKTDKTCQTRPLSHLVPLETGNHPKLLILLWHPG